MIRFAVPIAIACFLAGVAWGYVSAHFLVLH
jgi:hypothetical protein